MRTAFYLRLSMADGDLGKDGKDESNSIENQRMLLEEHFTKHKELEGETVEYIDDGYTGTNFDRPAFRRMIEDAKQGSIQAIMVKDLSRLGRDYIGVGDYIDQIFPVLGIRLIAVNSNYDSNMYKGKTLGLDMTITNLVNTMYSRDISKKVKSGLISRWKQGKTTCGNPPYGFIKDESARGGWAIDPEAGDVVRKIFDKALEGYCTKDIANFLNEEHIPTPGKYRKIKGRYSSLRRTNESEILWNNVLVLSIINRYEYTGAFVHNKREGIQVGQRATRTVPENERIITDDAHDAIITKEEYYQAQNIKQRQRKHKAYKIPLNYPLKGKIFCGNCGLALAYQVNLYEPIFYCHHGLSTGKASKCCRDHYSERIIEDTVYMTLCKELEKAKLLSIKVQDDKRNRIADETKLIRKLRKQKEILKAERIRSYETFADGHVSRERYMQNKQKLSSEIDQIDMKLQKISADAVEREKLMSELSNIDTMADAVIAKGHLDDEAANNFVERVIVYDSKHLEVEFKFRDVMQDAVELFGKGEEI